MLSPCGIKTYIDFWKVEGKTHLSQNTVNMLEFKIHISIGLLMSDHLVSLCNQCLVPGNTGQLLRGGDGDEEVEIG